jgi:hypothetical protein
LSSLPGNDSKTKIATTDLLVTLGTNTDVKGMLERDLDPDGIHVCSRHFLHDATAQVRGVWLCKTTDSPHMRIALVEMKIEDFLSLPTFEDTYER